MISRKNLETAGEGIGIAAALSQCGLTSSNSEAFAMIQQGGVKIDGEKISDRTLRLEPGFSGILAGRQAQVLQSHRQVNRLSDIDWIQWQAKDPATLVLCFAMMKSC